MKFESQLPKARSPLGAALRIVPAEHAVPMTVSGFAASRPDGRPLLQSGPTTDRERAAAEIAMLQSPGHDIDRPAPGTSASPIGDVPARRDLRLSGLPHAIVSSIVTEFLQGCATYAAAMYGIPLEWDERSDRGDSTRDDPNQVRSQTSCRSESVPIARTEIGDHGRAWNQRASGRAARDVGDIAGPDPTGNAAAPESGWMATNLARFRSALLRWTTRRSALDALRAFDDRSLNDIGISRCDVERLARDRDPCG